MKKIFLIILVMFTITLIASSAQALIVTATADPLWTDTGINVNISDVFLLSPSLVDAWTWRTEVIPLPPGFGAGGENNTALIDDFDKWITGINHGELIGFVGTNPNSVGQNDSGLFQIGAVPTTLSGRSGELWLGFNDDWSTHAISDNKGAIDVNINKVPEPSALLLIGAGIFGIGLMRRRFKK